MKREYKLTVIGAQKLAQSLAAQLKGGEILALVGPLGSGKTAFTKYLGKELKVKKTLTSPTFTLMHGYKARLKNGRPIELLHLDLYRTKNFREVKALGLQDLWGNNQYITVIEWANKIKRSLPAKKIMINFFHPRK